MKQNNIPAGQWRNSTFYGYTDHFSRQDWAWEFLRANPEYGKDYYRREDPGVDADHGEDSQGGIKVNHQTMSDLKAGEWGLLKFC